MYVVADSFYSKRKWVDDVVKLGWHSIGKLRQGIVPGFKLNFSFAMLGWVYLTGYIFSQKLPKLMG